jgi:YidC/Oxa1 family membrane protein insertase
VASREAVLEAGPRIKIETPRVIGSIALKGARIDDISLVQFRETVDPKSPAVVLLSPSGTAEPYYAEFLWLTANGSSVKTPNADTIWQQEGSNSLSPSSPVVLKYDNGQGLTFTRTISIDDRYLFSIKDEVNNLGSAPVTLYPFALISRGGKPPVSGYAILHEGPIGYLGEQGLQEYSYKNLDEAKTPTGGNSRGIVFSKVTDGWLGITDKYWATALLPETNATLDSARFTTGDKALPGRLHARCADHSDRRHRRRQCAAVRRREGSRDRRPQLPAGRLRRLQQAARPQPFRSPDRLGPWLHFITRPMFGARLQFLYGLLGNFGLAILSVTVLVKAIFFPLANRSYASMAAMRRVQPEMKSHPGTLQGRSRRPADRR